MCRGRLCRRIAEAIAIAEALRPLAARMLIRHRMALPQYFEGNAPALLILPRAGRKR